MRYIVTPDLLTVAFNNGKEITVSINPSQYNRISSVQWWDYGNWCLTEVFNDPSHPRTISNSFIRAVEQILGECRVNG